MRILPLSLWALIAAQLEARTSSPPSAQTVLPTAVRKMPPDQGEKFYHSYCAFPDDLNNLQRPFAPAAPAAPRPLSPRGGLYFGDDEQDGDSNSNRGNSSAAVLAGYRPPFAVASLEEDEDGEFGRQQGRIAGRKAAEGLGLGLGLGLFGRRAVEAFLRRRQWACPTGTSGCGAIGYPNSCCQVGETCVAVKDTGLGPVGCCPAGTTCAGSVNQCSDGSTPCGSDVGGGCCIPGFVCQGVGCVKSSSATPTPTGIVTLTSTSTSVVNVPSGTPSTVVVTVIVTVTPSQNPPSAITTTSTKTTTQTTASQTPTITSSNSGIGAPYRPTSSPTNGINTYCPTGFYACLASAGGGCCQTGRDCQTTSCPPVSMTTIVNTNGITVVVPADDVPVTTATGSCAAGWFLCGSDAGPLPGCCPSGYGCGTASCSFVTDGATATVAKEFPSNTGERRAEGSRWLFGVIAVAGGMLMF